MTKAETVKRAATTTARGRGSYAPQACSICRGKKTKCDGTKPICGPCSGSGRHEECSWGRETGRKPRTEAHFEAMRKRANALEEYVNLLEAALEKCRREHGGVSDNGQSYLQFRPVDNDPMAVTDEIEVDNEQDDLCGDNGFAQEFCAPANNLKLEEGILLRHGNTAIFRFAPETPSEPSEPLFPSIVEDPSRKYILLTDPADENNLNYDPDFDWSRFLPAAVPLNRVEHDRLLDLVFKFFTSWCLRIVPDLFLRDMRRALSVSRSQNPPRTTHYSPMLHNALIAVATAFSDDPRIRDMKARQYFASTAKGYIESECQQPSISIVHALSLLGSYHSGLGEQTLGYLYFGMSARVGQALGLCIDCSAWAQSGVISKHDMLDRNWAHWTTFTQDVCWSLYVGRDFCVSPSSEWKRIPIPFVDTEFDDIPWHYPPSGVPPQPNYLSRTFVASCELLMIARQIMEVVNGLNSASTRHVVNDELISNIDLQLNTWKSNLSPELDMTLKSRPTATPHRLMMHCTYWWFFILLHRPFYHRRQRPVHSSDKEIDHVKLCKRAAENIVELLGTWRTLYSLRYSPITLVQAAFSAGTIYLLIAVQATTGLRVATESLKHSLFQAQQCVQYLHEIGKSWQCATKIADILKSLLQKQLKPILDRRAIQPIQVGGKEVYTPSAVSPPSFMSSAHGYTAPQATNRNSQPTVRKSKTRSPPATLPSPDGLNLPVTPALPLPMHQVPPAPPTATALAFNDCWSLGPNGNTNTPITYTNPPDKCDLTYTSKDLGMDPSSGFLAMLCGEQISNAPFLPTFSRIDHTIGGREDVPMQELEPPSYNGNANTQITIPESEFAVLEQFWAQHFG